MCDFCYGGNYVFIVVDNLAGHERKLSLRVFGWWSSSSVDRSTPIKPDRGVDAHHTVT